MRVAIGADDAGYELKQELVALLSDAGHAVTDLGTHDTEPVDYPDYAAAVARAVLTGGADRGIVVCGSGGGASIAANKLAGIRCAVAHDGYSAHQVVEHDDANVLAIGSRVVGSALAWDLVATFLAAEFSGEERHRRRLAKVEALESEVVETEGG